MPFDIRRIKGTPLKLVYANDQLIGAFYYGHYVASENFDDRIVGLIKQGVE